jgi:hypothetical protein
MSPPGWWDDNVRSAALFLIAGAVGVAVLKGLGAVAGPTAGYNGAEFAAGYWFSASGLCVTNTQLTERCLAAVLFAFAAGTMAAGMAMICARLADRPPLQWAIPTGRLVGLVALAYLCYAALARPCHIAEAQQKDQVWYLRSAPALGMDLPWPVPYRREQVAFSVVDSIGARLREDANGTLHVQLWLVAHSDTSVLASHPVAFGVGAQKALERAYALAHSMKPFTRH